jgi:hypothetical protein
MLKKYLTQLFALNTIAACALFSTGCGGEDAPENSYQGDGGASEEEGPEPEEGGDDDPEPNEEEGEEETEG